jgi:hypothetical protein
MNPGHSYRSVLYALKGVASRVRCRVHVQRLALAAILFPLFVLSGPASSASLPPIKEISYYPRSYAWLEFWETWPAAKPEMDADLDLIHDVGANTVRIFVHPHALSYPDPPTKEQKRDFREVIELVEAHGLKAHVTLFDCWWSWDEIDASKAWMADLVAAYRGDPRIAVWELQNEVPLYDEEGRKNQVVHDWVEALFPYLKQLAGDTPCTVSVSHVEWLADVKRLTGDRPDLYSLHWYPPSWLTWTSTLTATLQRAKELVNEDKLLLGEFGIETSTFTEATQADLYRDVLYYARQEDIVHLGAWTLHDFPEGTKRCDPAKEAPCEERYFGIYREDGTSKPAAQVLKDAYHGRFPTAPSPSFVRNPSFEERRECSAELKNWGAWSEPPPWTTWYEQDCTEARIGDCSVRVQGVPSLTVGLYNIPGFPIESGKRYSLEGYAKTEALQGQVRLVFSWSKAGSEWLDKDSKSEPITGANVTEWTRLHIDRVLPPDEAAYGQVFVQVRSTHTSTLVWVDDVTTLVYRSHLPLVLR